MAQLAFLTSTAPLLVRTRQPALSPRRPARAPLRACAQEASASSKNGKTEDASVFGNDKADDDAMHPSWSVYSRPGNACVVCNGKGSTACMYCFGEGTIKIGPEAGRDTIVCPLCKGTGVEECARCEGTGIRPATRIDFETGEVVRNLTNEEVCELPSQADVEAAEAAAAAAGGAPAEAPVEEDQRSESVVQ